MTTNIAHEINNPLAGMIQMTNVISNRLIDNLDNDTNTKIAKKLDLPLHLLKEFMEKREIPKMLQSIKISGLRVSNIISSMLSFARQEQNNFTFQDINTLLDKSIDLAYTDFSSTCKFDFKRINIKKDYSTSFLGQ